MIFWSRIALQSIIQPHPDACKLTMLRSKAGKFAEGGDDEDVKTHHGRCRIAWQSEYQTLLARAGKSSGKRGGL